MWKETRAYVVFSKSAFKGYPPLTLLIIRNFMDPGLLQAWRGSMTRIKCRRTSAHEHLYVRIASYLPSAVLNWPSHYMLRFGSWRSTFLAFLGRCFLRLPSQQSPQRVPEAWPHDVIDEEVEGGIDVREDIEQPQAHQEQVVLTSADVDVW